MVKKVKEVTGFYNPFITKKVIPTLALYINNSINGDIATTMNYKCITHLPFYCLPMQNNSSVSHLAIILNSVDGITVPNSITSITNKEIKEYIKGLWEKGEYRLFIEAVNHCHMTREVTLTSLKFMLKDQWRINMGCSFVPSLRITQHTTCTGVLNIFNRVKAGAYFGTGKVNSKSVKSGPFSRVLYLFGRYFLAYYVDVYESGLQVIPQDNVMESKYVPIPLMSLMFKVEYLDLIKGYQLNNKEVPSELLELWVDKSLDDLSSPHPVRLQYNKLIKKPLIASGVTIKVVDNLDGELYDRNVLPNFKSIKLQKAWSEGLIESVMDSQRVSQYITKNNSLSGGIQATIEAPEEILF